MQSRRQFLGAGCGLALGVVVAACGGSHDTASIPASADHNAADVTFVKDMIPHHAQAIEMAVLAETRASSPKVKELATRIKGEQDPEIAMMSGWLKAWGGAVPSSSSGTGHGGGHGGGHGMMSDTEMKDLAAASGPAFDKMFLRLMTMHHEGALEMAQVEQGAGKHQPAKDLAAAIIATQRKEIDEMKGLLAEL